MKKYVSDKSIYEDNANGKLSDSRVQMLSDDYEQEELREQQIDISYDLVAILPVSLLNDL